VNTRLLANVSAPTPHSEAVTPFQAPARERERQVGFGYGNSSGYGTRRRYTTPWAQARFRCG